jgi:O-antigen/teichoic acid export membrane protein
VYETGKWVVLMVGISKIIDMGTGLNSEILINSKFYRYDLLFYIVLAVSVVVGNLIFIPLYSYNGAALAALIALALYNTIKFLFIWKKMGFQPFEKRTILILAVSLVIFILVSQIPILTGTQWIAWAMNIGIRTIAISGLFLLAGWQFNLSPDLEELIHNYRKK